MKLSVGLRAYREVGGLDDQRGRHPAPWVVTVSGESIAVLAERAGPHLRRGEQRSGVA